MPTKFVMRLLAGTALSALLASAAVAEARPFNIPEQDAAQALQAFAMQSGMQVLFPYEAAKGKRTPAINGDYSDADALAMLAQAAGLRVTADDGRTVTLKAADGPQSGSAAGDGAEVETLIVTAQKREEDIQDVPIAISAFTQEDLEEQKIEGGFDLLKAIPNVTFSKNNFTSYNFSIRGIGTKAVSATTDPGVAVSFNNTALLQNRLFEQEYFDIERVEVLRGPQGTLYGRNATAGVVNVITAKPDIDDFKGWVKGEVGNYHTKRLSAMVNVPLIDDKLAVRFAGAMTDRQGYDFNEGTGNAVNGRDLWSARLTLAFNPTEAIRTSLIWERFNEDDDRSRTSKQLCHRDDGPTMIGSEAVETPPTPPALVNPVNARQRALFSQGCMAGSLYDDGAFGTPNGLTLPFVFASDLPTSYGSYAPFDPELGYAPGLVDFFKDPYGGMMQSRDLRVINSVRDPRYTAKADVVQLNLDIDFTDALTLSSQTVYNKDSTYSTQDYNRFNTVPIFSDTSGWVNLSGDPSWYRPLAKGSLFCDPQLGCSNKLVSYDLAQAKGTQLGQELRLQSDFEGPINFSAGANYTHFKTLVDYYVFSNLITALALQPPFNSAYEYAESHDPYQECFNIFTGYSSAVPSSELCPYVDPNPLESINGEGHNYFRSKNPYKLTSSAAFGELYWNVNDALKVTAGVRYTDDRKTFIPVPSQVLLAPGLVGGGTVARGYPELPAIKQHWGEWTGRLGVDWKPDLSFTDSTMLYAFYSRGYKGGGANPPSPGFGAASFNDYVPNLVEAVTTFMEFLGRGDLIPDVVARFSSPLLNLTAVEYDRTFRPEFVNAFEVGAKNTLMQGAIVANANAFFYDYKDYQVSQIRDRTAVNENFDAKVWGLEFQGTFAPSRNLQIIGNIGYLDSEIGKDAQSIDIMDRTAGNPDFALVRSWAQLPSNCILPVHVLEDYLRTNGAGQQYTALCGGSNTVLDFFTLLPVVQDNRFIRDSENVDPDSGLPRLYNPLFYDGTGGRPNIHGGAGIAKNLSGNELPNAPHWTVNLGGQYAFEFREGWRATVRGDAYWQSQSFARVFNAVNDKLHGWYNANLSLWLENDDGLKIELYAKNILDKTPITDAFINSDDSALTTNVFALDPRLIGLSIRKEF